jgi:hypothetical protein
MPNVNFITVLRSIFSLSVSLIKQRNTRCFWGNIDTNLKLVIFEILTALLNYPAIRGGEFLDPPPQDEGSKFTRIFSSYSLGDTTACPPKSRPSKYRVTYRSPAICGLLKGTVVLDFSGRWIHGHQLLSQHAPGDSHSCVCFHRCAPLR